MYPGRLHRPSLYTHTGGLPLSLALVHTSSRHCCFAVVCKLLHAIFSVQKSDLMVYSLLDYLHGLFKDRYQTCHPYFFDTGTILMSRLHIAIHSLVSSSFS